MAFCVIPDKTLTHVVEDKYRTSVASGLPRMCFAHCFPLLLQCTGFLVPCGSNYVVLVAMDEKQNENLNSV
jgi:hypothetical protein